MPELEVIPVQFEYPDLLDEMIFLLGDRLGLKVTRHDLDIRVEDCYDDNRQQYDAVKILKKITPNSPLVKAVIFTSLDIFIPILTFVFGLAGLGGGTGIVSSYRLKNEFYGLPPDEQKLIERYIKETIHEYGHLKNLRHCHDYQCVMASSNTVDDLDVKGDAFCSNCLTAIKSL
jgi:archaemetzincin